MLKDSVTKWPCPHIIPMDHKTWNENCHRQKQTEQPLDYSEYQVQKKLNYQISHSNIFAMHGCCILQFMKSYVVANKINAMKHAVFRHAKNELANFVNLIFSTGRARADWFDLRNLVLFNWIKKVFSSTGKTSWKLGYLVKASAQFYFKIGHFLKCSTAKFTSKRYLYQPNLVLLLVN